MILSAFISIVPWFSPLCVAGNYSVGRYNVTYLIRDPRGNDASCTFFVHVELAQALQTTLEPASSGASTGAVAAGAAGGGIALLVLLLLLLLLFIRRNHKRVRMCLCSYGVYVVLHVCLLRIVCVCVCVCVCECDCLSFVHAGAPVFLD